MANIIRNDSTWTRAYVAYREFGAGSMFGESCLTAMTMTQTELLSLSQLYDVLHSQSDVMDDMPERMLDYPSMMSKWYSEYTKKRRKDNGKGSKRDPKYSTSFEKDPEADAAGYARAMAAMDPSVQKNTDWALKYMKKTKQ
jgi:hypothetical protein